MVRRTSSLRMFVAAAATVVALFATQQASAQTIIFVGGGATFPTSDFGDYANTGWQVVGGVLVPVGPAGLHVGAEGFYGQNNHKEEVSLATDSKTTPYGAMGVVEYSFQMDGKLTPYVFGGAGVLIHKFSAAGLDSESETQFGYEGGVGVSFDVSPTIGIWVEGRYMGSSDTKFFAALAGLGFAVGGAE